MAWDCEPYCPATEYAIHNTYLRCAFRQSLYATLAQMRLNKDLNLGPHD